MPHGKHSPNSISMTSEIVRTSNLLVAEYNSVTIILIIVTEEEEEEITTVIIVVVDNDRSSAMKMVAAAIHCQDGSIIDR